VSRQLGIYAGKILEGGYHQLEGRRLLDRQIGGFGGIMVVELMPKRLELLSELVPRARLIALLVNPNDPNAKSFIGDVQNAAHVKGLQLDILRASSESEIDGAFASLVQLRADALVVAFFRQREQLVALAARYAVPAIYPGRAFTIPVDEAPRRSQQQQVRSRA
jgi:putative ABC transport system substrate-binding protein